MATEFARTLCTDEFSTVILSRLFERKRVHPQGEQGSHPGGSGSTRLAENLPNL